MCGSVTTGNGTQDAVITRIDPQGNILWTQTFGGPSNESAVAVFPAPNGSFMVVGTSNASTQSDCFMSVFNSSGALQFTNTYGTSNPDVVFCATATSDGGLLIYGSTIPAGSSTPNAWTLKTNNMGQFQWSKHYGNEILIEKWLSIRQTPSGYVGVAEGYLPGSPNNRSTFWVTLDANGVVTLGRGIANYPIYGNMEVIASPDGTFYACGSSANPSTGTPINYFIVQMGSDGVQRFAQEYDLGGQDAFGSVKLSPSGSLLLSGSSNGKPVVLTISPTGVLQGVQQYTTQTSGSFYWLNPKSNGGFTAIGPLSNNTSMFISTDGVGNIAGCTIPVVNGSALASTAQITSSSTIAQDVSITPTALSLNSQATTIIPINACPPPACAVSITLTPIPILCFGQNSGRINSSVVGATGTVSYQWSNGTTQAALNNVSAGTYTVTVTDGNGCTTTGSSTVTQPTAALGVVLNATPVTCFGQASGSVQATVTGGTGTKNYAWSNGTTQAALNNVSAGTYTVTVTDGNGCTTTGSSTVTQPTAALSVVLTSTPTTCFGQANGSVQANVSGAVSYQWSNGANTPSISQLVAANYALTVTDGQGCTATSQIVVTQPQQFTIDLGSARTISAGQTDTLKPVFTNGTPPFKFKWAPTTGLNSDTVAYPLLTRLSAGEYTYTVTVTDSKSCNTVSSVLITVTPPVCSLAVAVSKQPVSCDGGNDGSLVASPTNGNSPYLYLWSNDSTSQAITALTTGIYTVTVTDGLGCSIVKTDTVSNAASKPLNVNFYNKYFSVFQTQNDTLNPKVSNGVPPYTYAWVGNTNVLNDATIASPVVSGNQVGTYKFKLFVTDALGCQDTDSVTVEVLPLTNVLEVSLQASGVQNNALKLGDMVSYRVLVKNLTDSPLLNTSVEISLPAFMEYQSGLSDYPRITVPVIPSTIDIPNNTIEIASFTAKVAPPLIDCSVDINTVQVNHCAKILNIRGINLSDQNFGQCLAFGVTALIAPLPIALSTETSSICQGQGTTVIASSFSSNNAPITFTWAPTTGLNCGSCVRIRSNKADTVFANPTTTTTYTITATQGSNCVGTATFTLTVNPTPVVTAIATQTRVCRGASVQLTSTLTPSSLPVTYLWQPNGSLSNNSVANPVATPTETTTYTLLAYTDKGCQSSATVTVNVDAPLQPTIAVTSLPSCLLVNGGTVTANANRPGAFTYVWSTTPVRTGASINGLVAGIYTVTVSGGGQTCSATATVTLEMRSPTNVKIVLFNSPQRAKIDWDPIPGAVGYTVRYRKMGTTNWTTLSVNGSNNTDQTVNNLSALTTYEVQVSARCSNGAATTGFGSLQVFSTDNNGNGTVIGPFITNYSNNTVIQSSPNHPVGIGTTNPQATLDVAGKVRADTVFANDFLKIGSGSLNLSGYNETEPFSLNAIWATGANQTGQSSDLYIQTYNSKNFSSPLNPSPQVRLANYLANTIINAERGSMGFVGIGLRSSTSQPLAKLHLVGDKKLTRFDLANGIIEKPNGDVIFEDGVGTANTSGLISNETTPSVPITGTGTRFMWLQRFDGALRAGTVTSLGLPLPGGTILYNYWDKIGSSSIALGTNVAAHAIRSISIGNLNASLGDNSVTLGTLCVAKQLNAMALGVDNYSSGELSFTFGVRNTASEKFSLALGRNMNSSAEGTVVIGTGSKRLNGIQSQKSNSIYLFGPNDENLGRDANFRIVKPGLFVGLQHPKSNESTSPTLFGAVGIFTDKVGQDNVYIDNIFKVEGFSTFTGSMFITGNGPNGRLDRADYNLQQINHPIFRVRNDFTILNDGGNVGIKNMSPTQPFQVGTNDFVVTGQGNVGIGTTSPQAKLSVNGLICAKELRVQRSGQSPCNFPDYVFDPTYRLMNLDSLEVFVKCNRHLPNIPSATQVEKDGIEVGDMQARLVEKVEELTLYLITLKKEIDQLKRQNENLQKQLEKR